MSPVLLKSSKNYTLNLQHQNKGGEKSLRTFIMSMYAIMLCSKVASSRSSSSSRRLRSWSPSDRYLNRSKKERKNVKMQDRKFKINTIPLASGLISENLSIISWGPWSIPIPSRSNMTASRKASSQNCSWSHSVERSLPGHTTHGAASPALTVRTNGKMWLYFPQRGK